MAWRLNPNKRSVPVNYRRCLLKKQGGKCADRKCRRQYPLGIYDCQTDHIITWKDGGRSTEDNLRVLCIACHNKETEKFRRLRWARTFYNIDRNACEILSDLRNLI